MHRADKSVLRGLFLTIALILITGSNAWAYCGARLNPADPSSETNLAVCGGNSTCSPSPTNAYIIPASGTLQINVTNSYLYTGNVAIVHIGVEFHNSYTNSWYIDYDANNGTNTVAAPSTTNGDWTFFTVDTTNAYFGGGIGANGADFQIRAGVRQLAVRQIVVWCRTDNAGVVSISTNQFLLNGKRFVLVGSSWVPPWLTNANDNSTGWWDNNYDTNVVERELKSMEIAGCNLVRVHCHFQDFVCPGEGVLSTNIVSHVRDFFARAQAHGLKVKMSMLGRPDWVKTTMVKSVFGGGVTIDALWMNDYYLKEYADFLVQFFNEAELWRYDSLFSVDLSSEPKFAERDDLNTNNVPDDDFYVNLAGGIYTNGDGTIKKYSDETLVSWNRWIQETYGSATRAYEYWGSNDTTDPVMPPTRNQFLAITNGSAVSAKVSDYYTFLWNRVNRAVRYIREELEARCNERRPFVTVDFTSNICNGDMDDDTTYSASGLSFDNHRGNYEVDYASLHIYSGQSNDPAWYNQFLIRLHSMSQDKPVTLAEFGWNSYDPRLNKDLKTEQAILWEGLFGIGIKAGLDGIHGWCWTDYTNLVTETNDWTTLRHEYFGVRTEQDVKKPAYYSFTQLKTAALVQDEPVPGVVVWMARDAFHVPLEGYFTPYQNFIAGLPCTTKFPVLLDPAVDDAGTLTNMYFIPGGTNNPAAGKVCYTNYLASLETNILWQTGSAQAFDSMFLRVEMPSVIAGQKTLVANAVIQNTGTNNWSAGAVSLVMTLKTNQTSGIITNTVLIAQAVGAGQQITQAVSNVVFSVGDTTFPLRVKLQLKTSPASYFGSYYETDISLSNFGWTQLTYDDFETSSDRWGNWCGTNLAVLSGQISFGGLLIAIIGSGTNAVISPGTDYVKGTTGVRLRGNSTNDFACLKTALNLTNYTKLKIEFTYMPVLMQNSDKFRVKVSNNGGTGWVNAGIYTNGVDFTNGVREYPALIFTNCTFTTNMLVKFQSDATSISSYIFVDNVGISAQ